MSKKTIKEWLMVLAVALLVILIVFLCGEAGWKLPIEP